MPNESDSTKLIVDEAYKYTIHWGMAQNLAYVRDTSWIPKGWQSVKKYKKDCLICKRIMKLSLCHIPVSRGNYHMLQPLTTLWARLWKLFSTRNYDVTNPWKYASYRSSLKIRIIQSFLENTHHTELGVFGSVCNWSLSLVFIGF